MSRCPGFRRPPSQERDPKDLTIAPAALNLITAVALGSAIGLERQWRQRLAGLRTNTLVALGAA